MNKGISQDIYSKQIDSYQKLHLLLFLYQHPEMKGTYQEFAERLYFGDTVLLAKILADLQLVGLVEQVDRRYKLCNKPAAKAYLQRLARAFDDPLTRQEILSRS